APAGRGHPHDAARGRRREPPAPPARVPPPDTRTRYGRNVNERRLAELYQGVAVHATADREHMAALELLAVVMLADHHIGEDELDVLKEISEDWRGTAFSVEQYLGQAVATARGAWAHDTVTELLDSIDARIT